MRLINIHRPACYDNTVALCNGSRFFSPSPLPRSRCCWLAFLSVTRFASFFFPLCFSSSLRRKNRGEESRLEKERSR